MAINIRKLEAELWESADLLRAGSKLTSNQYCMPVLGLIFLRYAYSRFKMVEAEILKNRPSRGGRVMPVEASDFAAKSALFLPKEAQYDYLLNLPDDISAAGLLNKDGQPMTSLGEVVNLGHELVRSCVINSVLDSLVLSIDKAQCIIQRIIVLSKEIILVLELI